ncbi:hypothetical protein [Streptomyces sp. NPDC051183]|uniref:hypothetical protein n=1 Tax=unclassified Streptomyces TaxID=2593676 RepID=UPI003438600E
MRAVRERLRASRRHRTSRVLAPAPALRAGLDEPWRLRKWEPVPEDAPRSGQPYGGTGPGAGRGLTDRLCIALPDALC